MSVVDLNTKVIASDHLVWALHPGRGKRQYNIFLENNLVFLEIPGFSPAQDTMKDDGRIRQHLLMSDAVVRYSTGATTNVPNLTPSSYSKDPVNDKNFVARLANVVALYRTAKVGDLVLVPAYGQYKETLIGEIASDFSASDLIQTKTFPEWDIPFREVKWLNTSIPKRDFSRGLAKRLENRHAIIAINGDALNRHLATEVYKSVYDSFVFDGLTSFVLHGRQYDSKDPARILDTVVSLKYFVAAFCAAELNELRKFSQLSQDDAIKEFYDAEKIQEFTLNFNSPGKIGVTTAGTIALGAIILFGVATEGMTYDEIINQTSITNSASQVAEPVISDCFDRLKGIMRALGEDKFNEVAIQCRDQSEALGIRIAPKKEN